MTDRRSSRAAFPAPPPAVESSPLQSTSSRPHVQSDGYRSLHAWGRAARLGVATFGVALAATVFADLNRASVVGDIVNGNTATLAAAENADLFVILSSTIYFAALLGSLGIVIAWLHRATRNLIAWGEVVDHSPALAIGGWFIPFANFVIPHRVLQQAWTRARSDLSPAESPRPSRNNVVTAAVVLYIGSSLVAWFSTRSPETLEQIRTADQISAAMGIVQVVSAALFMIAINQITTAHTLREQRRQNQPSQQNQLAPDSLLGRQPV